LSDKGLTIAGGDGQDGKPLCRDIQAILYSTEDGFEVPQEGNLEETF
jgi:hypothetical protein